MVTVKPLPLAAAGALVALVACANLAGLEDPDPSASSNAADGGENGLASGRGFSVTPESVTLTTSCSGAGEPAYISIENQSDAPAEYELQVPDGSAFALRAENDASVGKLQGTLPARGVVLVYLSATPTKAGTFAGQMIVRVGEQTTQVPVQVIVNGGTLELSPDLVDFGEVQQQRTSQPQTIQIANVGTEPVNVLGFVRTPPGNAGAEFAIDLGAGSVNIAPGKQATVSARLLPDAAGPPVSELFEPRTQEPTCGALPKLTLEGTRVNQDVTVNPASLDFGEVGCQTAGGATRTITVSNYGPSPADFTVSTSPTSWFEVSTDATSVPKATGGTPGTRTITVKLKPVGSAIGDHAEPIEVNVTTLVPPKKTTVTASVKSVGAVLTISPAALNGFANDQTRPFTVKNTGNKFVYVRHTSSNTGAFAIVNNSNESALTPGAFFPTSVDVKFVAQANGTHSADIVTARINSPLLFPESANLCEPPAVVKVTATK